MRIFKTPLNPEVIASRIQGKTIIQQNNVLNNVAELSKANAASVCFYENPKFLDNLKSCDAGLIFVPADFDENLKPDSNLICVEKPYINFMMLVRTWLELDKPSPEKKIADSAVVSNTAKIGENVQILENCVIGENVTIGNDTIIEPNCVIKENTEIGNGCHFFPNVTVYDNCIIKSNVILHSGVVIGADGFGYLLHEGIQNKVPQVGNVIIEDEVEIGANSAIDRAAIGSTIIGKGTKIDNLVQVGHNCIIGKNSILCAQVGLAGSTEIGDLVYLAGQVGVAGHLKIEDGVMVGAQSGVSHTIPANTKVFGTPAIDAGLRKRIMASEKKLPELVKYYKKNLKKKDKK
ncbi:MAG: UDP-3-O-(3-hydroxymyristoyl)glucosamine N-acyltransferase [Candidatus Cloacimonetes bacterium]|nr:UDP-3-O-(3-hydroxymyristoyl)glucosamine N-acyltransferase [Candidatus Cloacimonadota bacterium]MCF7815021.1 UDP-3-O-(3-hydroxymyristoyl)glucosamine N-acyltransferase [Candidatus Cloacimonadota bacterium]MCF7869277.1 UDP-3-O-(3-hydroxymyristoyl)glucosamine N-acyltransferase [Candidatus Cloacimonadota bacterium]MCF7884697.1 UDP-3-O-(3-hydroxymyristoyl)glucosamine N-acyltransferase [Candidatus Cloacimonadota bacterium]